MNDIRPSKKVQRPAGMQERPVRALQTNYHGARSQQSGAVRTKSSPPQGSTFEAETSNVSGPPPPASSSLSRSSPETPKKRRKLKIALWSIVVFLLLAVLGAAGAFGWYILSLDPVSPGNENRIRVEIVAGSSPSQIGKLLEEKKLIRSSRAFDIYTRLTETRNKLQAGTYNLSPSESTKAIVDHLLAGKVDQFSLTFLPGATLAQNRAVLLSAGYTESEVDTALKKTYNHPLFATKPETADLEGYIYGETYKFDSSASVENILKKTFDYYYEVITKNNLIEGFKNQELTLYEGITLASIIQREVSSQADQQQVAQVFFTRLSIGMELGADATFQYAAKKLGVPPSVMLDSPYNTRRYPGLPPGPIATPGLTALKAVAAPATSDFLYFVSGDDGVTYFARTLEEHEANTQKHCQKNCLLQ